MQTFAEEFSLDTLDAKMDLDTLPVVMPSESFQVYIIYQFSKAIGCQ